MTLPGWPPRDWRAFIALTASIAGAAVLTAFSVWLVRIVSAIARADPARREQALTILGNSNYGLLGIIGAVLLSLGLAINRRSIKGSAFGATLEASGGDDPDPKTIAAASAGAAAGAVAGAAATKTDDPAP